MVLGQEATAEKSNEITAIPKLLSLLDIRGCIITIDAMGCQTAIAQQIIDQGGDYCLAVKDNQRSLSEAVEDFFDTAVVSDFKGVKYDYTEETDNAHGRLESRQYWICEQLETLPNTKRWKGLKSVGMVKRETTKNGLTTVEKRFFINSFPANAKTFAHAVRSHWGIENSLHWRLDVVMREDDCRIRIGNAPTIFSTIRHLCLNLFQAEPSKLSLKRKRMKSALNDNYRAKVVFGLEF
jgi:predicted transposase YbfD/YdcC